MLPLRVGKMMAPQFHRRHRKEYETGRPPAARTTISKALEAHLAKCRSRNIQPPTLTIAISDVD